MTILDTARTLLDDALPISLDSVAQAAGLSKPGLMYHFPTKSALMDALVDHVVTSHEQELARRLPVALEQASVRQRLGAYVQWTLESAHRRSDLVMFADPKLADRMTVQWVERFRPWLEIPDDVTDTERARLHAARLLADGAWLAACTGIFPLADDERPGALAVALELLGEQA